MVGATTPKSESGWHIIDRPNVELFSFTLELDIEVDISIVN